MDCPRRHALRLVSLYAALLAICPSCLWAQQVELVSPAADEAVTVDGLLVEPAWDSAARVGPLVTLESELAAVSDVTMARIMHDDRALYIGITCQAREGGDAPLLGRDSEDVWQRDHVEVFVSPRPDEEAYYHLVVARGGGVLDAAHEDSSKRADAAAWNGEWMSAVVENQGGWSCEIAIPYPVLEARRPARGDLWRLKVCRDGGEEGPISWPGNPSSSFHTRSADGALYFEAQNLLTNGDFERGNPDTGALEAWQPSMTSPEVNNAPQGEVRGVDGGLPPGTRALYLKKLITALYWPQVWSYGYKLQPGGVYEFSVMARGSLRQVNLRATGIVDGNPVKMSQTMQPSKDEFTRLRFAFVVPDGSETVNIGLSAPAGTAGEVIYDDAVLRRVLRAGDAMAREFFKPDWSPEPAPIHGLEALVERAGQKPWDLYWRGDHLVTQRVIFEDETHGTELWMLDNSPVTEYGTTASIWPGWNADCSILSVRGRRIVDGVRRGPWYFNADFSRLTPMPSGGMPLWDLEDPDSYYEHSQGKVAKVNWRTGSSSTIAEWEPRGTERSYGLTKDNRSVFVVDWDGGEWIPYEPGEKELPPVRVLDCYGKDPDGDGRLPTLLLLAETGSGPKLRVMIGRRVYTDTGETERVIVPISGRNEYLETFASGRVQFPDLGAVPQTKDLDELFNIYQLYPSCSHGHLSYSPDGEYTCWDGSAQCYRTRDGEDASIFDVSPNGSNYHACWFYNDRFFVSCVRAYRTYYDRPVNAGLMYQAFTDGTWQPVCNIKMRPNAFYYGGNFATLSRDATKIHYASNMTGVFKNYVAVLARPQAPRDVSCEAAGNAVTVTWALPPHHREMKGALVYRSDRSGDSYRLLTPEPVATTSYRDATVVPGRAYYYVATSLEHCGLESGYSNEARGAVGDPTADDDSLVIYAEAEAGLADLPSAAKPGISLGRDRLGASDWYYAYRTPKTEAGATIVPCYAARAGKYFVWLRARQGSESPARWMVSIDGERVGRAAAPGGQWEWVRASADAVVVRAGSHEITLETNDAGAQADLICLATDANFQPQGARPEDVEAPGRVAEPRAELVRDRVVHVTWPTVQDADVSHYNVYSAREAFDRAQQRHRVASPTQPEFIDWGLRAGTDYHYAVTAVDRHGNESALSPVVQVTTPARDEVGYERELAFSEATLTGPFDRAEATGTHSAEFVLLPGKAGGDAAKQATVAWQIDVPREGDYYAWLRYLPRGMASSRSAAVEQNLTVSVDGNAVGRVGGGPTDLSVTDSYVRPEFWTWARPVATDLTAIKLPAGKHTLTLSDITPDIRYDTLLITDEPAFLPPDGRIRQQ